MDIKELKNKVSGLTLLYVEDEEEIRKSTALFFLKIFTNIDVAENGVQGLELFYKKHHDIVVSDIKMPKMDGKVMVAEIKKIKPNVITVMMSGFSSRSEADCIECDFFISKPASLEQLLEIISKLPDKME